MRTANSTDDGGMMAVMTVTHRIRATIVTPTLTYTAHELQIDEAKSQAYIIDRNLQETIVTFDGVTFEHPGGDTNQYRLEGTLAGEPIIVRAVKVCPSCASQAVWATPAYDIPV